ncbi:hypothetical protein ACLK1S_18270 [Escherichia coli]
MNLKLQLKILSFLQFCLWGSWLTTLGSYMFFTLRFDGASIGHFRAHWVSPRYLCLRCWGLWPTNG